MTVLLLHTWSLTFNMLLTGFKLWLATMDRNWPRKLTSCINQHLDIHTYEEPKCRIALVIAVMTN